MNFNQLRQLEAIARSGTMSGASCELHVTQPALTRSMQRLEADLGTKLFDRTRNRVSINEAGLLVLQHARAALAEEQSMRDGLAVLAKRQRTLRVASVAPAPVWHLTSIVTAERPGTILESDIVFEKEVEDRIFNATCDLGVTLRHIELPTVACNFFVRENLFVTLPQGHRLAGRSSLTFSELDGEPFLVYEQIGFWLDVVRANLTHSHVILQNDRNVFLLLLQTTDLLGFTTNAPQSRGSGAGRVVIPIDDADAHADFWLCVRHDAESRVLDAFAVATVEDVADQDSQGAV